MRGPTNDELQFLLECTDVALPHTERLRDGAG
jgi:hypothetical protein